MPIARSGSATAGLQWARPAVVAAGTSTSRPLRTS
jgi:hypothetical protein